MSNSLKDLGKEIGDLCHSKNEAYGNSAQQGSEIIKILYPNGIPVEKYPQALITIRILDKLSRLANDPGFGGEDPAIDIAGYGLCLTKILRDLEGE